MIHTGLLTLNKDDFFCIVAKGLGEIITRDYRDTERVTVHGVAVDGEEYEIGYAVEACEGSNKDGD